MNEKHIRMMIVVYRDDLPEKRIVDMPWEDVCNMMRILDNVDSPYSKMFRHMIHTLKNLNVKNFNISIFDDPVARRMQEIDKIVTKRKKQRKSNIMIDIKKIFLKMKREELFGKHNVCNEESTKD